ncbi:RNA polymerase sigma factor [uncultured Roseobacter sp.]|uniref:RNA polymerase sigma factor n=1 Tax=uncultured Roseobacter sp. TaxID=114847 RepID=UPI00262EB7DE|nr:RNA polymerase sigma factor [uncultured Roseobacter sp.]
MTMPPDADPSGSDDALLRLYAQGDATAARRLSARLLPRVYAHATRLLGDAMEAEDVAQEAMLRLWRTAPEWRPGEAKVTTWLYRVTANLCIDRLRKRRGVGLDEIAEPADPQPGVAQQMQDRSRHEALQAALATLPERQRQAVVLRHIEGLSNPEIAQVMEISPRAVESLTARGKRALTALLAGRRADLGYDDEKAG